MSWVRWLKGLTDRTGEGGDDAPRPSRAAAPPRGPRAPRKGGEAYAKEWVRVLEESTPGQDPSSTYTWELHPDTPPHPESPPSPASSRVKAPKQAKPGGNTPTDPFDTYTWELQEGDSAEDPWGLQRDAEAEKARKDVDGVNPYDTGVFDASWTGRFDQR